MLNLFSKFFISIFNSVISSSFSFIFLFKLLNLYSYEFKSFSCSFITFLLFSFIFFNSEFEDKISELICLYFSNSFSKKFNFVIKTSFISFSLLSINSLILFFSCSIILLFILLFISSKITSSFSFH